MIRYTQSRGYLSVAMITIIPIDRNCSVGSCVPGGTMQRYFYPVSMGGILTQRHTWLGRNRMICSCGTQFELLIEWKGYVQWALSIVSLSLRCAETVMKSSWTLSQRSCDRSSGGCHFAFAGHITRMHLCARALGGRRRTQESKQSHHFLIVSQLISSFVKVRNVQCLYS